MKKGILKNFAAFAGKHLCQSLSFNKVTGAAFKKALAQVFSCEFCEISKTTFFTEQLWMTASTFLNNIPTRFFYKQHSCYGSRA